MVFIYFLVSLFVKFLFWPHAVDQDGYFSVYERTLNIIITVTVSSHRGGGSSNSDSNSSNSSSINSGGSVV